MPSVTAPILQGALEALYGQVTGEAAGGAGGHCGHGPGWLPLGPRQFWVLSGFGGQVQRRQRMRGEAPEERQRLQLGPASLPTASLQALLGACAGSEGLPRAVQAAGSVAAAVAPQASMSGAPRANIHV